MCVLWSLSFQNSTVLWCVEVLQMSSALWLWERPFTPSSDPRVRLVCPPLTSSKIFSLVLCTLVRWTFCNASRTLGWWERPFTPIGSSDLAWEGGALNMPYTDPSADSQHSLNRPNWRNGCFLIVLQKREAETVWICSEFVFRSQFCVNVQSRRKNAFLSEMTFS